MSLKVPTVWLIHLGGSWNWGSPVVTVVVSQLSHRSSMTWMIWMSRDLWISRDRGSTNFRGIIRGNRNKSCLFSFFTSNVQGLSPCRHMDIIRFWANHGNLTASLTINDGSYLCNKMGWGTLPCLICRSFANFSGASLFMFQHLSFAKTGKRIVKDWDRNIHEKRLKKWDAVQRPICSRKNMDDPGAPKAQDKNTISRRRGGLPPGGVPGLGGSGCSSRVSSSSWGYPELAGWSISWKIPSRNGWWLGVALF